jgi:hypothetical protein
VAIARKGRTPSGTRARHPTQVKPQGVHQHIPPLTLERAQALQGEAERGGVWLVWIVVEEKRRFVALPVTEDGVQAGSIIASSLTRLRQIMPLGLVRSALQPSELPGAIEIWHAVQ